jgi:fumarylpyruvate hydrolase
MPLVIAAPPPVLAPVQGGVGHFPVRRIYCVGRNYVEHAREMGGDTREPPFFFGKPADALACPGADGVLRLPFPAQTTELHHEVEMVLALGTGGSRLDPVAALACIWGQAVGIDLTRRDLQARAKASGRPWDLAKGFDQSAPLSPIRPCGAGGPLQSGAIWLDVNGTRRQSGDLSSMIWNAAELLAALSVYLSLAPGDLVFTGTPAGVGAVQPGDRVLAGVEGVGELQLEFTGRVA